MASSPMVEPAGTMHSTQYPGASNFEWGATARVSTFALQKGFLVEGHRGKWLAFAQLSEPRLQHINRWKEYYTGRAAKLNLHADFQDELRDSFKKHTAYIVIKEDGVFIMRLFEQW